jgi:hypothetical protein
MGHRFRFGAALCAAVLLLMAAGCTPPPPRPAMVAQTGEITYGYADRDLGEGRYEVSYETPVLRTSSNSIGREDDIETEKRRAYDLALWRAAQIATERGYERIVVASSNSEANVEVEEDAYYPGYGGWYGAYGYGGWPDPYYGHYAYSPFAYAPPYHRRYAYMQVTVTLTVREAGASDADTLDAQATAARMATQYGNAVFPGN